MSLSSFTAPRSAVRSGAPNRHGVARAGVSLRDPYGLSVTSFLMAASPAGLVTLLLVRSRILRKMSSYQVRSRATGRNEPLTPGRPVESGAREAPHAVEGEPFLRERQQNGR